MPLRVVCNYFEMHLIFCSLIGSDPSTTAKASVDRKAVMDHEFGSHIAVGASMILKNVFSPPHAF